MNVQTIHAAMLCISGFALSAQAQAGDIKLPQEGWASWQVDAVEDAPAWCCFDNWGDRDTGPKTCQLDDDRNGYGSRDKATTDSVRVYAHVSGAKVDRLRAYSASCQVEAKTPIQDLGSVAADDSARSLVALSKNGASSLKNDNHHDDLFAALAMHRGDVAQNALASVARGTDDAEIRKKAVFWLGMVRGTAGAEVVSSVMFNDKDPELRQHAAFAIAQGKSARAVQDLIRQGNTDKDSEVRAQAWFWLAQTGAADSEGAITAALKKDTDDHVREQAIFALSQLPDERATRALIAAAEDRTLPYEQRKRALFWLGQSETDGAQKYLDKVLAGPISDPAAAARP
jgi:HEAT repeats